jgi:hypothetical protein
MASAMNDVAEVYMPGAAPLPRSPSVLLLGDAAGLLAIPGCPACRYPAESSDSYLTWFALEGHADPDVLQMVCASRGMCPRHTRRLLAQPGAASRLTVVYRYVIAAVLRNPGAGPASCPGCDQETAAEDRVLGILLDELATGQRAEYKAHGGLCLPHLRRAARRRRSQDVRWLIRFMIARLGAPEPDADLLAGARDPDTDSRAGLRAALPRTAPARACPACWAAAAAERALVADVRSAGTGRGGALPADRLCRQHLRDAASGPGLLAWQAELEAERLAGALDGKPRLLGIAPGWLSPRAQRALADPDCAVCRGTNLSAAAELREVASSVRHGSHPPALCARHVARLCAADALAGRAATSALTEYATELLSQLKADFGKRTPDARASGARGPDAWRRAAALLDGSVFGGCAADQP